jgi:competence protein ComEC
MLAVPLTAFWVMPWGLAALALMPLGLDWVALAPMGWGIAGLTWIAHGVAGWPASNLPVAQAPPWSPALIAAGLAWGGLLRGRVRLAGVVPLVAGVLGPLFVPSPDLLVAPEGRLIALRLHQRIFVQAEETATAYESQAPRRVWGIEGAAAFSTQAPDLFCDVATCRTAKIVLVRSAEGARCEAPVIVSRAWLHATCPGALVIDHGFVQREGATLVRLTDAGPVAVTDRGVRGTRPWVIAGRGALPMAKTE